MSQQVLDLRRSVQIVRRRKVLVGAIGILGILAGCGYAVLHPPLLTGTALVVLPQSAQSAAAAAAAGTTGNGGPDGYSATQEVIASSNAVLSAALPEVRPAKSLEQLRGEIQIGSPTPYIISINATAKVAADAEATANAVARSYVAYVNAADSPIGRVSANLLEPATSAAGRGPLTALIATGVFGAFGGALIGVIVALAVSRNDKRLRQRDEIANSIGIPVLASLPVAHPSDAKGWATLLQDYRPRPVYAWRLRMALQRLRKSDDYFGTGRDNGEASLLVLSLVSDSGALALGPQLAVFAASLGIPTGLVIGPQQDASVTATLRTACSAAAPAFAKQSSRLRVAVHDDGEFDRFPGTVLTVMVVTVDGQSPQIPDTMPTTATVLAVSAGAATADQLARVAVSAAIGGREIVGILVADPEPDDNTTGQAPQLARPLRRRLPTRLNGLTTEIRR
jgi:capsular polysaccharide biosynthesis protein